MLFIRESLIEMLFKNKFNCKFILNQFNLKAFTSQSQCKKGALKASSFLMSIFKIMNLHHSKFSN